VESFTGKRGQNLGMPGTMARADARLRHMWTWRNAAWIFPAEPVRWAWFDKATALKKAVPRLKWMFARFLPMAGGEGGGGHSGGGDLPSRRPSRPMGVIFKRAIERRAFSSKQVDCAPFPSCMRDPITQSISSNQWTHSTAVERGNKSMS